MGIQAFGGKVIVKRNEDKSVKKGLIVVDGGPVYVKGTVISAGPLLKDKLEEDMIVIYSPLDASQLGLGYPDTYDVIEAEYVICVISD